MSNENKNNSEIKGNGEVRNNPEKGNTVTKSNTIMIRDGKLLEMQGVLRVDDFDKDTINLDTDLGPLVIRGRELHIAQLLPEYQALTVEGEITSVCFEDGRGGAKKQGGFFKRLTR